MTPSILIIEQQPAIRSLLVDNLRHAGYIAAGASDQTEGLALIGAIRPDLIISNRLVADRLRSTGYAGNLQWLLLTDRQGTRRGETVRCLHKPFTPSELIASVRISLAERVSGGSEQTLCAGSLRLDPLTHRASCHTGPIDLKPQAFRLLAFFMAHPGRVYTRSQLIDVLPDKRSSVSERAIDVQIRRLRIVLEAHGHGNRIETIRGTGYRFSAHEDFPAPGEAKIATFPVSGERLRVHQ